MLKRRLVLEAGAGRRFQQPGHLLGREHARQLPRVVHAGQMAGELGAVERGAEEETQRRGRAVERRRLHAALGQMHLEAAHVLGRCRVGRAAEKLGKASRHGGYSRAGSSSPNLRTAMSSSMRRRRSLMGFSLIGGSCLEVGGSEPLDPQDGAPTPSSSSRSAVTAPVATAQPRAALSRVSGFVPWH